MAARSKARKRAVDVLYEADLRGVDAVGILADRVARSDPPVHDYTVELVEGTTAHEPRIDAILTTYADGWSVDRMPDVDRAVLRLGVYELLWREDVPSAVVIDEAVELAKTLSTDESPAFVNGVLGHVLRDRPSLIISAPAAADRGGTRDDHAPGVVMGEPAEIAGPPFRPTADRQG